jgi:hypothetical protein
VHLISPAECFPYSSNTSTTVDIDHGDLVGVDGFLAGQVEDGADLEVCVGAEPVA